MNVNTSRSGFLLVLGSANVDESLRGAVGMGFGATERYAVCVRFELTRRAVSCGGRGYREIDSRFLVQLGRLVMNMCSWR